MEKADRLVSEREGQRPRRAQIADTLFRAQKFQEAIAAYRALHRRGPQERGRFPLAHLRIANSEFNMKDDAATVKEIQDLVAEFPSAPESNDGLDILEGVFDRSATTTTRPASRATLRRRPSRTRRSAARRNSTGAPRVRREGLRVGSRDGVREILGGLHEPPGSAEGSVPPRRKPFRPEPLPGRDPRAYERLLNNFEKSDDYTPLAVFHIASAYYALENVRRRLAATIGNRLIEE